MGVKYTDKVAKEICSLITQGESLRHISMIDGMPGKSTILRWLNEKEDFRDQYARAKKAQADAFAEEILDIVDDGRNDWIERENERTGQTHIVLNEQAIARARLRMDARKWLMGKMKPKKYGDKYNLDQQGKVEVVIKDNFDEPDNSTK